MHAKHVQNGVSTIYTFFPSLELSRHCSCVSPFLRTSSSAYTEKFQFFLSFQSEKIALLAAIVRATKTKIMTENKQMIMDRDSGEPGEQSQQAPITSETSELQQRPQAVSSIAIDFIIP